ncbi:MAG: hypothetical protein JWO15_2990 [Sphingomonadales bacterium]|nr:hypothetical protein [Sphingomonadales bacterium]
MRTAPLIVAGLLAGPANAALAASALAGTIGVTIPTLSVAEYHRPYVAGWLEPAAGGPARTVFVWYSTKKGNEPGTKWLAELRTWWRKGGRSLSLPADGVSGATRTPGTYQIPLPAGLKPGPYKLFVESARETGGRELVTVPISIPATSARVTGTTELGAVTVSR